MTEAVDHGPQAPSIAIARMAATCGVGRNKGPIPRQYLWTYDGPEQRPVPQGD